MKPILPFGKYLLLERISVGGMAEVFKARVAGDGSQRLIAIKRILPSMAEDADFITMFIDEARISGSLNHQHIAQIFELSQVSGSHFIAMEFVWGKDVLQLQNRFRRQKSTMPFPMAAFIASKICDALDYAHRKKGADGKPLGIIHRDVSPQNVLISYQGEVKVIDFGIAKAASRSTKTQAGVLKGKFGYMSPEQVAGHLLDRRSDVFSIGTILFEMITADRLFVGESDFATLEKVRNVDVRMPIEAVRYCPPEIDRIIRKALSKTPDIRYQWASEMAAELNWWLASLSQPFGERELAAWMQQNFATEMKREAHALEEQLRAAEEYERASAAAPVALAVAAAGGAQVVSIAPPPLPAEARGSDEGQPRGGGGAQPPEGAGAAPHPLALEDLVALEERDRSRRDSGLELPGDATIIIEPSAAEQVRGEALAAEAAFGAPVLLPDRVPAGPGAVDPEAGAPAAGDADQARPIELAAESTRILGADEGVAGQSISGMVPFRADIPAQPTTILDLSSGPALPGPPPRSTPPPILPYADPNPLTGRVDALPYAQRGRRRSTFAKDVLIGVALASALLLGVAGNRIYRRLHPAPPPPLPPATLVVTVNPPLPARVLVDGVERGAPEPGRSLTLKGLAAGSHRVEVRGGERSYSETVLVSAGDVAVVSAQIAAPPPPSSPGLNPPTAAETPAAASPPAAVTEPRARRLVVRSEPAGAEVHVNGRSIGLTPVDSREVPPGRSVRVSLRRKGYAPIARYLDFESTPDRTLDLRLVPMRGVAPEQAGPTPAPGKPGRPGKRGRSGRPERPVEAPRAVEAPAAPAADPMGFLVANTQPWAHVFIDGKDTGKSTPIAPLSKLPLLPGAHTVTFVVDGKKYSYPVEVKAGEVTRLIKTLGQDTP